MGGGATGSESGWELNQAGRLAWCTPFRYWAHIGANRAAAAVCGHRSLYGRRDDVWSALRGFPCNLSPHMAAGAGVLE